MSTTEGLLVALLSAGVGAGLALAFLASGPSRRSPSATPTPPPSADAASVLRVLRSSSILLDGDLAVVTASPQTRALGLVVGRDIGVPELTEALVTVAAEGGVREIELTLTRHRDPIPRFVTARVARLTPQQLLVLVEDRTRERRLEAVRRDFVANVSHELKTPVGAIRILAEAVEHASDDPEAVQRFATRMHTESDRLGKLVQQIIELSRLQGDDPLESPVPVEVDKIVARAVDGSAIDAHARGITVARSGDDGLEVLGNEEQIAVAVGNLVSNAVTYSPDGATVAVAVRRRGDRVEVAVTDQGIGIPSEEHERIFERFYRVDPARHRSTGGTGLGLSIVKHVAASHGGEIRVWSVPDQGSTFTLMLPRWKDDA